MWIDLVTWWAGPVGIMAAATLWVIRRAQRQKRERQARKRAALLHRLEREISRREPGDAA